MPQLKDLLQGEYKTLDCFRRENAKRAAEKAKGGSAAASAAVPVTTSFGSQQSGPTSFGSQQ